LAPIAVWNSLKKGKKNKNKKPKNQKTKKEIKIQT
jgi:hypothetical protein